MSQGPNASRPSSNSLQDDRSKRLPPFGSRALPPLPCNSSPPAFQEVVSNASATPNVPAQPPPHSSTPPDQRSSRPIGFQNLLNPTTSGDTTNGQSQRRNGDHSRSPPACVSQPAIPIAATPALPTPSLINHSAASLSLPSITPPTRNAFPQLFGHMTPRSPSAYVQSPISVGNPSATMDAKHTPFVLPRDHPAMVGASSHIPPEMARIPSVSSDTYGSSLPPQRSPPGRRESADSSHGFNRMQNLLDRTGGAATGPYAAMSTSDSPSTQYSSYSQMSRITPPAAVQPSISTGQPQSFFTAPFSAAGPASAVAQMKFDGPSTSSATGGGAYQLMTIDTENGPIQVPVDVQAASKVADEKRKRNATASHRFRQRRKEKERETSQNIAKLEQQIREIEEEREYYRRERDYFRDVATRNPGQAHLLPRELSPRQRRHASLGGAMGFGNVQYHTSDPGNRNGGRNTRRRTSNYVPPSGPAPQAVEPTPPSVPQFERSMAGMPEHGQRGNVLRLQEPPPLQTGTFDRSAR